MNEVIQLDELDRRILRIVQVESDISNAMLAERVGASTASCWRRLRALEDAGVLGATVRLLNPVTIGRGLDVVCQIRIKSNDVVSARDEFEKFVALWDEIMECYSMSGEWDYQLRIVVADVRSYEEFLMQHLLPHPAVASTASHFALKRIKYTTAMPV